MKVALVGTGTYLGKQCAYLYENGHITALGSRSNDFRNAALTVNKKNEVVGTSGNSAFLYSRGKMRDLNDIIPADCGWVLEEAHGINDKGQIVGTGKHNGKTRAFVLTPICH